MSNNSVQFVLSSNTREQHPQEEESRSRSSSVSGGSSARSDIDVDERIQCNFVSEQKLAEGKWLRLRRIKYEDSTGKEREWESVSRTGYQQVVDECVAVIGIFQRLVHYDQVILIKQYRPALRAYTVEMPCAMVLPGESVSAIAVRELKEVTGYTGEVKHIGPLLSLDSTISEGTMRLATIMVNGDSHENYNNTRTDRFDGDCVQVIMVPLQELLLKLNDFSAQGYVVDSRVHGFAVGLSMGSKPLRKRSRHETINTFGVPEGNDRLNNDQPV